MGIPAGVISDRKAYAECNASSLYCLLYPIDSISKSRAKHAIDTLIVNSCILSKAPPAGDSLHFTPLAGRQ